MSVSANHPFESMSDELVDRCQTAAQRLQQNAVPQKVRHLSDQIRTTNQIPSDDGCFTETKECNDGSRYQCALLMRS